MIGDRRIRGVKFVGSTEVGSAVAERCGKEMKLSTLEMSANDAFIVLDDANIDAAIDAAYESRMFNTGQAVYNAKRFIITEGVYEEFRHKLLHKIKTETFIGDPTDEKTNCGPLGQKGRAEKLKS